MPAQSLVFVTHWPLLQQAQVGAQACCDWDVAAQSLTLATQEPSEQGYVPARHVQEDARATQLPSLQRIGVLVGHTEHSLTLSAQVESPQVTWPVAQPQSAEVAAHEPSLHLMGVPAPQPQFGRLSAHVPSGQL